MAVGIAGVLAAIDGVIARDEPAFENGGGFVDACINYCDDNFFIFAVITEILGEYICSHMLHAPRCEGDGRGSGGFGDVWWLGGGAGDAGYGEPEIRNCGYYDDY